MSTGRSIFNWDIHIERKNQADTIGKEARASRNVLRVVAEACKLYLLQSGYPDQEKYEDEVILDAAEAKRLNRALDETLTDKVTAHKNYLIMVEGYLATVEGAIVDAAQSAVSLDMLEQNERVIAQGLNNLVVFTIPAWQRMIASAYIAAMSEQAADFIEEQNEKTNQFRKQTADILQLSFQAFARMINSTGFDDESMEYLTAVLAEGFRVITDAATQAEKAHDVSRVKQDAMMTKVQEAQRSFGTSNVKHSKKK